MKEYLQKLDVVFPVLHGLYGEDGTIQGLFELLKIPYVGCRVLASSVGMDKVYTKIVFEKAGLNQAPYEYVRKYKDTYIYIDKNFNEKILDLKERLIYISSQVETYYKANKNIYEILDDDEMFYYELDVVNNRVNYVVSKRISSLFYTDVVYEISSYFFYKANN